MKTYYVYQEGLPITADDNRTLRGYAAVWNKPSSDRGGYRDIFDPGIFNSYFGSPSADTRALLNHDSMYLLGRMTAGTLRLNVDTHGLAFELELPQTDYADNALALVRRGDLSGMSPGVTFKGSDTKWHKGADGQKYRTIFAAEPHEISLVTFPAFNETLVKNSAEFAEEIEKEATGMSLAMARLRQRQIESN